jgi:hypothetical protein
MRTRYELLFAIFVQKSIQLTCGIQEEVPPRNVLAQYHRKNGSNKPPESARLSTAALHQASQNGKDNPGAQESDDEDQPEDEDQARAARHSKSNGEAKPDTMAYYKGTPWWAILMKAKIKYRRHIALNHGFPDREEHLCDARDILLEEIEEFKEGNGILDSEFCFFIYFLYIYTFTYYLVKTTNQRVQWSVWYVFQYF